MTTDVKTEPNEQTSEVNTTESEKQPVNSNNELLEQMKSMLDNTIKEMKQTFDDKTKELNDKIAEKDKEIASLKQANANMALTSNFSKDNNGNPDYSSMDFEEVDWSNQAKSALENIDKKIFDLNTKETKE